MKKQHEQILALEAKGKTSDQKERAKTLQKTANQTSQSLPKKNQQTGSGQKGQQNDKLAYLK